ncbi:unnamed protein product, partial [Porites evermanni]
MDKTNLRNMGKTRVSFCDYLGPWNRLSSHVNGGIRNDIRNATHALHDYYPAVSCNRRLLERVTTAKILGVHMDEHLTWLTTIGCSPETAQPRTIPCSRAVSGVISDVK